MTDSGEFETEMVTKIKELLLQAPGVSRITIDGQDVSVTDLKKELEYWEWRLKETQGEAASVMSVNMSQSVR